MKTLVAIGGAVVKTAHAEIRELASRHAFDVLIHNGASLFHDFQRSTEQLNGHSYTLDELLVNPKLDKRCAQLVWDYVLGHARPPAGSLTAICEAQKIDVLLVVALGTDFWHLFNRSWDLLANKCRKDFFFLVEHMRWSFKYVLLGSAVLHPEVFVKAVSVIGHRNFTTAVVDFLPKQYRPLTRVAQFGHYLEMTHQEFLRGWLNTLDKPDTSDQKRSILSEVLTSLTIRTT